MLKEIWKKFLDILFPKICVLCRRYLDTSEELPPLCQSCFDSVELFKTIFYTDRGDRFLVLGPYENDVLRTTIHYLKYKGTTSVIRPLGGWIAQYLANLNVVDWINKEMVVVPVPLHPARRRERGFNQAELVAEILGERLGLNIETGALKRIKDTKKQVGIKDKNDRKENVRGCFVTNEDMLTGKSVILVDDVYTSGATIREAANALRKAGVKEINVFVLAKAG